MSQENNFVLEEVGLFVTNAQPFIAHEEPNVNINLLCSYAAFAQIWQSERFDVCGFHPFV
jgi:hypothetical protein